MFTHPKSEMESLSTTSRNQFPFESDRLRIRRLKNEDFTALHSYRNDDVVAKYQSWTDKTKEEIQALIDVKPELGKVNEWFTFAIAKKDTDNLIGECAFCINETFPQQAEIGITLCRGAQGYRYAAEAISAILNFLFAVTKIESIVFITYLENASCINLLGKLSASHQIESKEAHENEQLKHYELKDNETMFMLSKKEWLENNLAYEKKFSSTKCC